VNQLSAGPVRPRRHGRYCRTRPTSRGGLLRFRFHRRRPVASRLIGLEELFPWNSSAGRRIVGLAVSRDGRDGR
jgi:hypothetical protein